ncbi:MAG: asparagine synthase (glutamine-hydrolyzing), partial [Planctomycetota bacterium]
MCGIAGLVAPLRAEEISTAVHQMTDAITHRGPDDSGQVIGDGIGIGMRRLSIIDVAGGQQPIANESGDIHVICNGEIYNHNELRQRLAASGHQFRTNSDAEVIVHLYEDIGDECLTELRGMFGLAIWDQRSDRLLIARDRLGKKPIYFAQRQGRLWFGSEMKSLLAVEPGLRDPDIAKIGEFLQFAYVHQPDTMFRHIRQLPAGHCGAWENGRFSISRYWSADWTPDESLSHDDWRRRLDLLLEESVRTRLESEVPLGVFLSGGLDSSAVVAYAHRAGLEPLKTFTIAFDRPEWDESSDAKRVARHFGTDHHELKLTESMMRDSFIETLEAITHHCDEPFGDASAIPTYHISRLAREHVTVILSGDGGDELFAGYTSYRGAMFAQRYRKWLPHWIGRHVLPALSSTAASMLAGSPRYQLNRVAKVFRDSALPIHEAYRNKVAIWNPAELRQLLTREGFESSRFMESQFLPDDLWSVLQADKDLVSRLCEIDVRSYMVDDILVKVDRMSMAHSLEVRSPLLDHNLVELAAKMPTRFKVNSKTGKLIFRDVVRPQLPAATVRKA